MRFYPTIQNAGQDRIVVMRKRYFEVYELGFLDTWEEDKIRNAGSNTWSSRLVNY